MDSYSCKFHNLETLCHISFFMCPLVVLITHSNLSAPLSLLSKTLSGRNFEIFVLSFFCLFVFTGNKVWHFTKITKETVCTKCRTVWVKNNVIV